VPAANRSAAIISAAPVRYDIPAPSSTPPITEEAPSAVANEDHDEPMEDQEETLRSTLPGQKNFAERMMKKMGWQKGQGLGAEGTGIKTALKVQVEKRKKKPDALGGGFVGPSGMGRIIGGKKKKGAEDNEPGISTVLICYHMVDGKDLDYEMGPDGNLVEEIGLDCNREVRGFYISYEVAYTNHFSVRHYRARFHPSQYSF
jgi:splicing factor 45